MQYKLTAAEWYQENKYLTMKEVRDHPTARVVKHLVDGRACFVVLSETGALIGKVDPHRLWVSKMILKQEEREGALVAVAEDHDPGRDQSQPDQWQEGRSTEG